MGEREQVADARRVLAALCVTVTTSYGVLYYAFTVLAPQIATDTGWSATAVTGAFSLGSLVGALAGIPVGRVLQRRGPRQVMTVGGLLGAVALALVGTAPSYPAFVVAWLVAGAAGAATFYPPAFAALTRWFGSDRVRALTALTLVAGFASTVFAPLTATLGERLGWQGTYLAYAALMLVVVVPLHARALRPAWHPFPVTGGPAARDLDVLTSRSFVMICAAATLATLATYGSLVNLVPLLLDRGMDVHLAAWALGLGGAGQVAGRLLYPRLDRGLSPDARAAGVIGMLALSLAALALVPGPAVVVVAVAVVTGAARGLFTLVGATIVADHWGSRRYASLNGVLHAPVGVAAALAPALGAAVASATGSYAALFVVLAGTALLAAVLAGTAGGGTR